MGVAGDPDFAALALGAVDVPLYLTLTAEQVGYMLRDSGAKVAVVSSWEQAEKVRAAIGLTELPALEHAGGDGCEPTSQKFEMWGTPELRWFVRFPSRRCASWRRTLRRCRRGMRRSMRRVRAVRPEDLATIIYTSRGRRASRKA